MIDACLGFVVAGFALFCLIECLLCGVESGLGRSDLAICRILGLLGGGERRLRCRVGGDCLIGVFLCFVERGLRIRRIGLRFLQRAVRLVDSRFRGCEGFGGCIACSLLGRIEGGLSLGCCAFCGIVGIGFSGCVVLGGLQFGVRGIERALGFIGFFHCGIRLRGKFIERGLPCLVGARFCGIVRGLGGILRRFCLNVRRAVVVEGFLRLFGVLLGAACDALQFIDACRVLELRFDDCGAASRGRSDLR